MKPQKKVRGVYSIQPRDLIVYSHPQPGIGKVDTYEVLGVYLGALGEQAYIEVTPSQKSELRAMQIPYLILIAAIESGKVVMYEG